MGKRWAVGAAWGQRGGTQACALLTKQKSLCYLVSYSQGKNPYKKQDAPCSLMVKLRYYELVFHV